MPVTLQQLRYFREVARTLHFTIASQNLYVSQSSLSRAIIELEREMGVPLFVRGNNKKIDLTIYGYKFLPYVDNIFKDLEDGQQAINDMRNPNSGVVKIIYSYINGYSLVPKIFKGFYQENSREEISLEFDVNHRDAKFEHETAIGKYDLAICCTPEYPELNTIAIAKQELVFLMPIDHPLAGRKKLSLEDIKDEEFISYYPGSNVDHWIHKMFEESGIKPNIAMSVQNWSSQIANVSLGLGISITPIVPYDWSTLTTVKIDHPHNQRDIYLMTPANRKMSPATEYVKDYIIRTCRELHLGSE